MQRVCVCISRQPSEEKSRKNLVVFSYTTSGIFVFVVNLFSPFRGLFKKIRNFCFKVPECLEKELLKKKRSPKNHHNCLQ
jgi:hypothetical protein